MHKHLKPTNKYFLNGLYVSFSSPHFSVLVRESTQTDEIQELRVRYQKDLIITWKDGTAYALPLREGNYEDFKIQKKIDTRSYLGSKIVNWTIERKLEEILNTATERISQRHPFTILSKDLEVVSKTTESVRIHSPLLKDIRITPALSFEPKVFDIESTLELGIFLQVRLKYSIESNLSELINAGIDLTDCYVVRRNPKLGQRRYAGKIISTKGDIAYLTDSDEQHLQLDSIKLEGSLANFSRCVSKIAGPSYFKFLNQKYINESEILDGVAYMSTLKKIESFLSAKGSINISPDLTIAINNQVHISKENKDSVRQVETIEYCFDRTKEKRDTQAWRGIETHGPYSRDSIRVKNPSFLFVLPSRIQAKVEIFLKSFLEGSKNNSVGFQKGFLQLFKFYDPKTKFLTIPQNTGETESVYIDRIREDFQGNNSYDCVFIFLPKYATEDFYLSCKSYVLQHGMPVQQIKEGTLDQTDYQLQFTLKNLSVAVYSKLGGTPWTVINDETYNDEIVMGIGTAEIGRSRNIERKRFIGITTVFSGSGNYLLGSTSSECSYTEYPDKLEAETSRTLLELKKRNNWQPGHTVKVVFHCYKPLKKIEMGSIIKNAIQKLGSEIHIQFAFLTITKNHSFKILDGETPFHSSKKLDAYFPSRGSSIKIGRDTRLLSVTGPELIKRKQSPLPEPLLIHLDRENSTFEDLGYLTEQVLKFTSLSWKSIYPVRLPATIAYSELIAEALGKLKSTPNWSPSLLETKLKHSRWFL